MNTTTATETHTCNCKVCKGITFTAPSGYLSGATETHNYAQMVNGGPLAVVMAARGVVKVG